ncbi:winged helix DNA-binding domain-containing protein [Ktedonosporobacter rubrisoli]|uniref:Winged helix DNA-binding domain-containing protein n=1 Tax=Ktedonosporobacter rubrisoli TaxID=2509675 RepID=A0A4P6JQG9_KTERU|nr:winged helix DNA-binding domain-containing protein [Ktedonosporobacter rubrisoli]QBD77659.1 winged helix DNA-binding domain-containing protein [Ktedonosporobacter rubrisoli]
MATLKWYQVHAWRLSQHGLSPRFSSQDAVSAVARTAGIQAQVLSAAELAVCTRVEGLSPRDVKAAIFQDHTLVRTWAMRATLHLLPARELPLYVAARDWQQTANWSKYFAEFGLSSAQQDAFLLAIPHVLEQGSLTRLQLADAVARHTGIMRLRDLILSSSWGTPLKPSAYRGDLCLGPGQGKTVTFMNPRGWIDTWQPIEPKQALQEIASRYLRAYGPATANDFAFWWGCGKTLAKNLFQSMKEELEEVEVEGWRAFALRATLPHIQSIEATEQIHLLPLFDAYTIGVPRDCEPLLAQAYKRQVFNLQGWTFAVVLVNGSIQGVWHTQIRRAHIVIKVNLFSSSTPSLRKGIEAEAQRLGHLFEKRILLEYT